MADSQLKQPQMCYWRRLSKRSVDDFEYEYTANNSLTSRAASNSGADSHFNQDPDQPPVISESLSLFKALQVRQESEPSRARRQMRDIYAEDDEASLVCYRHKEVFIFISLIGLLLLLVITIAITCTMRIRKLTQSSHQYKHNRLADSMSPSLLSIDGALSSAGSLFGSAAISGSLLSLSTGGNKSCPSTVAADWRPFQAAHPHQHTRYHHSHQHQLSLLGQPKPPASLFQSNQRARACHAAQVAVR